MDDFVNAPHGFRCVCKGEWRARHGRCVRCGRAVLNPKAHTEAAESLLDLILSEKHPWETAEEAAERWIAEHWPPHFGDL